MDDRERTLIYIVQMLAEVEQWTDAQKAQHHDLIQEAGQRLKRITATIAGREMA